MQEKSESQILCEVFEDVRSLTKFYLSRAEGIDPYRQFQGEGMTFNTLYWLMGHIVWSEHYLLVEALTGRRMEIPWLDQFDNALDLSVPLPSVDELLDGMERVHEQFMQNILSLDGAGLDEENHAGIQFRAGKSKRVVIRHAIRHEPCHTGQIGWILKMAGKETV